MISSEAKARLKLAMDQTDQQVQQRQKFEPQQSTKDLQNVLIGSYNETVKTEMHRKTRKSEWVCAHLSVCVCACVRAFVRAFVRACVKDRVRRRCKERGMMSSRHSGHKFKLDPEFIAMREKKKFQLQPLKTKLSRCCTF